MIFRRFFNALKHCLIARRQRRRDFQTLSRLNAHMLKDIGLRWENGEIMPVHAIVAEENSVAAGEVDPPKITGADDSDRRISVCRYCGARLA